MEDLGQNTQVTAPTHRVIVRTEANSGFPLKGDFERMARRRHQKPKPVRRGGWWTLRVWKDTFTNGQNKLTQFYLLALAVDELPLTSTKDTPGAG